MTKNKPKVNPVFNKPVTEIREFFLNWSDTPYWQHKVLSWNSDELILAYHGLLMRGNIKKEKK